jgi:two-component system chemotaxis response regulator CheY
MESYRIKYITTLVVDDDPILRSLLSGILRTNGFPIMGEASNAEHALKMAKDSKPKLILLDINMPGVSGLDAISEFKKLDFKPKVVMISGEATLDRVKESLSKGASGFVVKPLTAAKLLQAIDAAFKPKEG